jgi:hypothetical protein
MKLRRVAPHRIGSGAELGPQPVGGGGVLTLNPGAHDKPRAAS